MPKPHSGSRSSARQSIGFGHELRFKEELPEPVGVAREMMAGLRGADAGIDADEQHADAGRDAVAKWHSEPGGRC